MQNLLLFIMLSPLLSPAQSPVVYTDVVNVDGVTKEQLFIRTREWFNNTFKSAKDVFQILDKESGELAGKGSMTVHAVWQYLGKKTIYYLVDFSLSIRVKDSKYKYEIKNLNVSDYVSGINFGLITSSDEYPERTPFVPKKKANNLWKDIKEDTDIHVKRLIASLYISLKDGSASDF